jgi:hypothetical protein
MREVEGSCECLEVDLNFMQTKHETSQNTRRNKTVHVFPFFEISPSNPPGNRFIPYSIVLRPRKLSQQCHKAIFVLRFSLRADLLSCWLFFVQ